MDSRAIAARILAMVLQEEKTLDSAFAKFISASINCKERAFIKELSYGVLRWFYKLDYILDKLLSKPLRKKDSDIKAIMLCGLYQLDFMRTPAHAAISASVEATTHLNKSWAKQLINAVLRRYQRDSDKLQELIRGSDSAFYAHPHWLIAVIRNDWPAYWEKILVANNQRPPMFLRVNSRKTMRKDYLKKLAEVKIDAIPVDDVSSGIQLIKPVDVNELPGFKQGLVSVQDLGAQHAAALLDLKAGQRVLDACAAPGGKTAHIHETEPELAVLTAIELDKQRIKRLEETHQRLGTIMDIIHADVRQHNKWWNGIAFDRILLDVPCSATGVIRRHPDIKIRRREEMIRDYCELQYNILESVWSMLKRGGKLVYVTCSILFRENDRQMETFLENYSDARNIDIMEPWGIKTDFGIQILPGIGDADGFYYAVLEKN